VISGHFSGSSADDDTFIFIIPGGREPVGGVTKAGTIGSAFPQWVWPAWVQKGSATWEKISAVSFPPFF
jgi:hypothetical protein